MNKVIGKYTRIKGKVGAYAPSATQAYKGYRNYSASKYRIADSASHISIGDDNKMSTYKYMFPNYRKEQKYEYRNRKTYVGHA